MRAFENQPGPILPVFEFAKYVSHEQISFKKLAEQHLPLSKTGKGQSCWFSKGFSKLKNF
jgi:hypothetical protein